MLALCVAGASGIAPFAVLRLIRAEWLLAAVDIGLVLGVAVLGTFVWVTRRVRVASLILTVFYMCGVVLVIYLQGVNLLYWAYPTMLAAFFLVKPREAILIDCLALLALMPLLIESYSPIQMLAIFITIFLNCVFGFIFERRMDKQEDELIDIASTDPLTGAGNRRSLDQRLKSLIADRRQQKTRDSVIILDLDYFKDINDSFGHAEGDRVLAGFAALVRGLIRSTDQFFRYGGEEFLVIATGTGLEAATILAEKLRTAVESNDLHLQCQITVSAGVAEKRHGESVEAWLKRADAALYRAKNTGRNRTCTE